jgi:hypothetical protein
VAAAESGSSEATQGKTTRRKELGQKNPLGRRPCGAKQARWVRPEVYCVVQFFGSTSGGRLRFPCFGSSGTVG